MTTGAANDRGIEPVAIADVPEAWPVIASRTEFDGVVVGVRVDNVQYKDQTFEREVITHPGAVAILAVDDNDNVLVVAQYRHAAQHQMMELPAGLLDIHGEPPLEAAKRELREEGGIEAQTWCELLQYRPSPGISDEHVWVYLATDLRQVDQMAGFVAEHEEATMSRHWVPIDDLVTAVLNGSVLNGLTMLATLTLRCQRSPATRSPME